MTGDTTTVKGRFETALSRGGDCKVARYTIALPSNQELNIMDTMRFMHESAKGSPLARECGLVVRSETYGFRDVTEISLEGCLPATTPDLPAENKEKARYIENLIRRIGAELDQRYPLKEAIRE